MPANTKVIFQEMFADFQNYYVLIGELLPLSYWIRKDLKVAQQKIMIWSSLMK